MKKLLLIALLIVGCGIFEEDEICCYIPPTSDLYLTNCEYNYGKWNCIDSVLTEIQWTAGSQVIAIDSVLYYVDDILVKKTEIDPFLYIWGKPEFNYGEYDLKAELYGNWLYIDASKSKGHNLRKVHLSGELKAIWMEIKAFRDGYVSRNSPNPNEQAYARISKTLLKIVRALKFSTNRMISLKSFRHCYGIRRVYITGNIFQVAMEMGHKSVTTTQHYLKFQLDELKDHFPSLIPIIENMENVQNNITMGTKSMGTKYSNVNKLHT